MQNGNNRDEHFGSDRCIKLNKVFKSNGCSAFEHELSKATNLALDLGSVFDSHIFAVLMAVKTFSWGVIDVLRLR